MYLSGQGPVGRDGGLRTGKVGDGLTVEDAYGHARLVGLNLIAVMLDALGNLNRVRRIVRIFGMVNATPGFIEHPKVIDGCSDLMIEVFGLAGQHARSAVGMGSLPFGISVEIEAVIALTVD